MWKAFSCHQVIIIKSPANGLFVQNNAWNSAGPLAQTQQEMAWVNNFSFLFWSLTQKFVHVSNKKLQSSVLLALCEGNPPVTGGNWWIPLTKGQQCRKSYLHTNLNDHVQWQGHKRQIVEHDNVPQLHGFAFGHDSRADPQEQ